MFRRPDPPHWTEPEQLLKQPAGAHRGSNPIIDIDGDTATAETDLLVLDREEEGHARMTLVAPYRGRIRRSGDGGGLSRTARACRSLVRAKQERTRNGRVPWLACPTRCGPSSGPTESMDLEVTEVGSGDALVVFVHGVLGHGRSFDRVADVLAAECRMLWYDRRGYSGSAAAALFAAAQGGHIADLLGVLMNDGDRVTLRRRHRDAAAAPQSVAAVVLYETSVAWVPGWDDGVMLRCWAIRTPKEPDSAPC
jgi:hypothetical protein